jgi:NAD(P)-dependent dehydrogenase (short-subunit alcohol dehydrogenase family)
MDLALTGKRALVTGATSGLGAEIARTLAAEGVAVAIGGRDRARGEAVAQSIRDEGGTAILALGDLTDDAAADASLAAAIDGLGGIDILVNALGYSPAIGRDTAPVPSTAWAADYAALVLPGVRMIHRATPAMREAGWGRVIQIASADAMTPAAVPLSYASAKAAIVNMSLGLAKALSGTGISVNTISPGLIRTPAYAHEGEAALIERHARQPVAGLASLAGIAAMAAWLASPLADHVTGANIRMDGGFSPAVN